MRKTIANCLVLLFFAGLFILASCATVSNVNPELVISPEDRFYVYIEDDPLDLAWEVIETFEEYGLHVEPVYNKNSVPERSTPEVSGTGFFISPDIIVTNEHVVKNETDITYYIDGIRHKATPVFVDENCDLAFLKGERNDNPYFALGGKEDYDILTSVFALGYPLTDILGNNVKVTSGTINSLSGLNDDSNSIQISAQVQPGNSGGPVVNQDFKVVGVVNSRLSDAYMLKNSGMLAQNVNFAIKSDLVSFFASAFLSSEQNYVSNLKEAMTATVKIDAGGTTLIPEKQYGIDLSYVYYYDEDWYHWTVNRFNLYCYDIETGDKVANASFSGYSIRAARALAEQTTEKLLKGLGLTVIDDDEEE